MKSFLGRFIYFVCLLIAANLVIRTIIPSKKYWGNEEYNSKLSEYKKDTYNVVHFGSSRILTGIDPFLFDSLLNKKTTLKVKSFNMATPGTWANETFYLYEDFLNNSSLSSNVKIVFMEFQNVMAIRTDKLSTNKVIYYQNPDNLLFVVRYAIDDIRLGIKNIPSSLYTASVYSIATIENLLNLGRFNNNETAFDSLAYFGTNERGYLGLDKIRASRKAITSDNLIRYTQNISTHLHKIGSSYNRSYHNKMMTLIQQSEEKGIQLIFVLPPVKLTSNMMALFNKIPLSNKVEVCDPEKFPELYQLNNWIDESHLSKNGSAYLTKYVANNLTLNALEQAPK
jgi:hypothetical protein